MVDAGKGTEEGVWGLPAAKRVIGGDQSFYAAAAVSLPRRSLFEKCCLD